MTYGYCPVCGAPVVSRERRINGNDRCEKGHCYESRLTIQDTLKKCKVDYIELGKRLVACKHFRWMPGMLTQCGIRIVEGGTDYIIGHRSGPTKDGGGWVDTVELDGIYPDLSDAATKGCVLQLIREVLNNPYASVVYYDADDGWYLHTKSQFWPTVYDSEAEAMVLAMEGRK